MVFAAEIFEVKPIAFKVMFFYAAEIYFAKVFEEYDRPQEKLHAVGAVSLTDAGLLAILLCAGSSELSVRDLCKRIMKSVKNEPAGLLNNGAGDFCKFPGVGVAKAATLMVALELGRRVFSITP